MHMGKDFADHKSIHRVTAAKFEILLHNCCVYSDKCVELNRNVIWVRGPAVCGSVLVSLMVDAMFSLLHLRR